MSIHDDKERSVLSREPWWEKPPAEGQSDDDLRWGWLTIYSDLSVSFDLDDPPSHEEIKSRPGCKLPVSR